MNTIKPYSKFPMSPAAESTASDSVYSFVSFLFTL